MQLKKIPRGARLKGVALKAYKSHQMGKNTGL